MGLRYSLSEEKKMQFAGIYVLEYIINKPHCFDLLLREGDADLEPILEWLLVKGYLEIRDKEKYTPTPKGREALARFMARYTEFLNVFDIYCAVDLETGEFAFSKYFEFDDPEKWSAYLNEEERWDDLRIAVAEFKKIDPVEIVFMSFINEKRFGRTETGWQFDLLLGTVWDEILEICETAIHWEELGFEDEEGAVEAGDVIKDIISQGTHVLVELQKKEARLAPPPIDHYDDGSGNGQEEYVDRVVMEPYTVEYYQPYYDPFYVSPIWLGLWLL